jgi:hypothetical protein
LTLELLNLPNEPPPTTTTSTSTPPTTATVASTTTTNFYAESKLMSALVARELARKLDEERNQVSIFLLTFTSFLIFFLNTVKFRCDSHRYHI